MSPTYLAWAKRNFALNGLSEDLHKLVEADCLTWLDKHKEQYDLVLLSPPTFSNSKKMRETLDIQRDHVMLVEKAMKNVAPEGKLLFVTNFRRFKLDENALSHYQLKDITQSTIDKDFQRDLKIHQTWEIQH